jgi:Uma2 family endonuclease
MPTMNVALCKPMGLAEFLAWEERQELRYEFDGSRPVPMQGDTAAHSGITFNLRRALGTRLSGTPCRACGPLLKIIAAGKIRYPDVFVTCSPIKSDATIIDDPVVVFEIVGHDNQRTDRIEKVQDYRATSSIQRYMILEQKYIGATVFTR